MSMMVCFDPTIKLSDLFANKRPSSLVSGSKSVLWPFSWNWETKYHRRTDSRRHMCDRYLCPWSAIWSLDQLNVVTEKLVKNFKPQSGIKDAGRALTCTLDKQECLHTISKIERWKTLIGLVLKEELPWICLCLWSRIDISCGSMSLGISVYFVDSMQRGKIRGYLMLMIILIIPRNLARAAKTDISELPMVAAGFREFIFKDDSESRFSWLRSDSAFGSFWWYS